MNDLGLKDFFISSRKEKYKLRRFFRELRWELKYAWFRARKGKTLKLNDKGIDCVIESLKRQVGENIKTEVRYGMGYEYNDYYCPSCNSFVCYEHERDKYYEKLSYCSNCGQKINWKC